MRWAIDFNVSRLKITRYVENKFDNNYLYKTFIFKRNAQTFLNEYKKITLNNEKICISRKLPCLLYKRRFLILSLMGKKNYTIRNYNKKWEPGTFFNLFDQTFFLTVKLIRIIQIENNFVYYFELPRYSKE